MQFRLSLSILASAATLASVSSSATAQAWSAFESEVHRYNREDLRDPMSLLIKKMESGDLVIDEPNGKALVTRLLKELDISEHSQVLVFSRTSLQRRMVHAGNPRALYFNEDVYLGWMPGGRIEIASIDPDVGPIFYYQRPLEVTDEPLFDRNDSCIQCHAGSATNFLPGLLGRSVYPNQEGRVLGSVDEFDLISHAVPFEHRWGGWFVSGKQVPLTHMANALGIRKEKTVTLDSAKALTDFFQPDPYLAKGSDILAVLLHDHQIMLHHLLNAAQYKARQALHDGESSGKTRAAFDILSSESQEEVNESLDELVRYMLFADEVPLGGKEVIDDGAYREVFLGSREQSNEGNSLKDLDLKDRLFKYRCSYMIYSEAFSGLPTAMKDAIYHRLWIILKSAEAPKGFEYLGAEEKAAIVTILRETKTDLPAYWKS